MKPACPASLNVKRATQIVMLFQTTVFCATLPSSTHQLVINVVD